MLVLQAARALEQARPFLSKIYEYYQNLIRNI